MAECDQNKTNLSILFAMQTLEQIARDHTDWPKDDKRYEHQLCFTSRRAMNSFASDAEQALQIVDNPTRFKQYKDNCNQRLFYQGYRLLESGEIKLVFSTHK
ncbi:MAG: hypothetical protein V1837_06435 [Candidatus Woesearchaeota archaeon]